LAHFSENGDKSNPCNSLQNFPLKIQNCFFLMMYWTISLVVILIVLYLIKITATRQRRVHDTGQAAQNPSSSRMRHPIPGGLNKTALPSTTSASQESARGSQQNSNLGRNVGRGDLDPLRRGGGMLMEPLKQKKPVPRKS
jgi:hypothetical protein